MRRYLEEKDAEIMQNFNDDVRKNVS